MTRAERKELRERLGRQFNKIGYYLGIRTDGVWVATPIGEGRYLKFNDIHEAEKFIEEIK